MVRIYLKLIRQFWRLNIARETQYRANFVSLTLVTMLEAILTVLPMLLVFSFTDDVSGWSAGEAVALVGLFRAAMAIFLMVAGNGLGALSWDMNRGELDLLLIRPVSAQFFITFRYVSLPQVVNMLVGFAIFAIGLSRSDIHLTVGTSLVMAVVFVCGLVLLTAAISAGSYLAFRVTTVEGLPWMLHDIAAMGQYPISFYPSLVQGFLTVIVPVAFVSTVPMDVLRGTVGWEVSIIAVLFAIASVFALRWWWHNSVRHYASASS